MINNCECDKEQAIESKDVIKLIPNIVLSNEIKEIAPDLTVWVIFADVNVVKKVEDLWLKLVDLWDSINIKIEDIVNIKDIKEIRQTYIKSWKKPAKYRGSAEALLRRIAKWKGLYQINNIVDINNYLSVHSCVPCWAYNISNLEWDVQIRIWKKWECYKGIWKDIINIENLPVFADDNWPFGSPTSDSERAMITWNTKKIMIMVISFWWNIDWKIDWVLNDWIKLLEKYSNAANISKKIIF